LAPPGDQTWHDHVNAFGNARPLDAVFLAGPDGFIARGLAEVLSEGGDDQAQDQDEDERHEREHDDDDDHGDPAFAILAAHGDANSFEANYGVALPREVVRLRELVAGHDHALHELELDEH